MPNLTRWKVFVITHIHYTYIHQEPTLTSSLPHTLNPGPTRTADPWTTESVSLALRPSWQSHRTCMAVIPIMTFPIRWATVNSFYISKSKFVIESLACLDEVDISQKLYRPQMDVFSSSHLQVADALLPKNVKTAEDPLISEGLIGFESAEEI